MIRLLLQTTIEGEADDWNVGRFSLLRAFLSALEDQDGKPAFAVTARDRAPRGAPDPLLSALDTTDFDQLWLFAVDAGDGLHSDDCDGIRRFRRQGGTLLVTRYPRDCRSGADGDFQRVRAIGGIHCVMRDRQSPTGVIQYLPSHPHEGAVSARPGDGSSRVVMGGQSCVTGRPFDIAIAFEPSGDGGRAIAQSTFHHFADYNWDPASGCPSFVTEPPGDGMRRFPEALRSTQQYVRNVAFWLAGENHA